MTPADKIAAEEARSRFVAEVLQREEGINLARAALLIASEEERGCDTEGALVALERMGEEALKRIEREPDSSVVALNRYLFDELGFEGDRASYYDARNSLLQNVLARRKGIPLTLSIVYMEVGKRAGLRVEGVGMPGHFIVRAWDDDGTALLVDPFNREIVDEEDCQHRLDEIYGGQLALTREHLAPASKRDILIRLLTNLKAVYAQAQMHRRTLACVERILIIAPHALSERRDRGILLAQLERFHEAADELKKYLNLAERARDAESVREHLKKVQMRLAMLN